MRKEKTAEEETVHVMITMPAKYHDRLVSRARKQGRTVSGLVRYWLDRSERAEFRKLAKRVIL